jgi:SAM-dependent methyltransferase
VKPEEIGQKYDRIASWWLGQMKDSSYGLAALERALKFVRKTGSALDVGCGCEGRFLRVLSGRGFECMGVDVSREMIALAKSRFPSIRFVVADICECQLPQGFDFISAWDSTFHLPRESQEPVLKKLCAGLNPGGVLLFSGGGGDEPGEIAGEFGGQRFEYSTLGVPGFLHCLRRFGCSIKHVEYDQHPENHAYLIAQKV